MDYKKTIREGFALFSQKNGFKQEDVARFFHPAYQQYVDGHHLDYKGFIAHMIAQRKVVQEMEIFFKTIVQEGNIVFTNHEVFIKKIDGQPIKIQVIAEFLFEEDKVIKCEELTYLMEGSNEDRDIGSRIH
ncbi:hypothetical protein GA0116948_11097 [Chitinophaga costaii]|uniref:SnoaL-like domain-containing protein n=1 Tax=Chitinophaga costaii TaxID=1335309 RepID=A0A1C4EXJ7_9BACT|nr:nuclear transport factor 2 family protein [Chitinophaga costaii]SCC48347.1 hypothetical protein GA0116948_11097 [Chitinophaga costaii]